MQKKSFNERQMPVTVWIDKQDAVRVRVLAARQNLSRSELIRRAIVQMLQNAPKMEAASEQQPA